ncbi:fimbrillin family protein [Parabacteroides sp. APC149_11_2_Y6]
MNKSNPLRNLAVAGFVCLLAASCSDLTDDDGTTLPDGKYPMTFTASVDGLTATRATTDNSSQWAGGEEVNIQVGSDSKTYTAASNGTLTCADGFYWQDKNSVNVAAWYPMNFSLTNIADQSQSDNYAKLDFLYSPQKEVPFNTTATLNFGHRMAKVTATLQAGGGLTSSDLNGAAVKFYGYTTATVDCAAGTITKPSNNSWITAYQSGSSYSALLIPQSPFPGGEKFISVTIGSNTYYYTPQSGDADTEAGKAYNYTITVHKSGILVSADGWQSMGEVTGTNDTNPSYTITVVTENLTDVAITNTTQEKVTESSRSFQYAFNATENPVLTFKTGSGYEVTGVQMEGIVKNNFECICENDTYTYRYTLSDVHSDVRIDVATVLYNRPAAPQVGDFLYEDGTFSHETLYLKTCAGVFYSQYNAVALHNAGRVYWRSGYTNSEMNNKINAYQPKVKNKNWYLPDRGTCHDLSNANSPDGKVAAAIAKAGGTSLGKVWTSDNTGAGYQSWVDLSTGEGDNSNDATLDVRAFLHY